MKARPLNDRVLIMVLDHQVGTLHQGVSFFSIVNGVPQMGDTEPGESPPPEELAPARGVIVSVGPGYVVPGPDSRRYVAMDVKVGDEVLFFEERGMKLTIEGEEFVLLNEGFILVVLDSLDGRPAEVDVGLDAVDTDES